jgi:twinkle protein
MRRFEVRTECDEVDGSSKAVYYPYHDHDGTVVGYKKRLLPKEFSVVGKIKGLFGMKQCKNNAKLLVLVEGEADCLAGWEILQSKGKDYNICSIPNGANDSGQLDQTLLKEMEWITKHEKVLVILDSDAPGKATAKALAEALCSQTKVAVVNLLKKDTAKYWEDDDAGGWWSCILNAKQYHPEEIVEGKDIDLQALRTPKKPGVVLPYPALQKMTWGLRRGEITLVTAASGIGKSTFVKELAYHICKDGHTVANIALETQMEDVARSYVAMDNNVPAHRLIFNPTCIEQEAYDKSV